MRVTVRRAVFPVRRNFGEFYERGATHTALPVSSLSLSLSLSAAPPSLFVSVSVSSVPGLSPSCLWLSKCCTRALAAGTCPISALRKQYDLVDSWGHSVLLSPVSPCVAGSQLVLTPKTGKDENSSRVMQGHTQQLQHRDHISNTTAKSTTNTTAVAQHSTHFKRSLATPHMAQRKPTFQRTEISPGARTVS